MNKIKSSNKNQMSQNGEGVDEFISDYQVPTIQEVLKGYLQFQRLSQAYVAESGSVKINVIKRSRRQRIS